MRFLLGNIVLGPSVRYCILLLSDCELTGHNQQLQEDSGTLDLTGLSGQNSHAPRRICSDGPNEVVLHLSRNAQNGFEI